MINDIDCTDDKLIRWFQENCSKIKFINEQPLYTRKNRKREIIKNVKNFSIKLLKKQHLQFRL